MWKEWHCSARLLLLVSVYTGFLAWMPCHKREKIFVEGPIIRLTISKMTLPYFTVFRHPSSSKFGSNQQQQAGTIWTFLQVNFFTAVGRPREQSQALTLRKSLLQRLKRAPYTAEVHHESCESNRYLPGFPSAGSILQLEKWSYSDQTAFGHIPRRDHKYSSHICLFFAGQAQMITSCNPTRKRQDVQT